MTIDKYVSYMLGFLWADGSSYEGGRSHTISIEILKDDMDDVSEYLKEAIEWGGDYTRQRGDWRPTRSLTISDLEFFSFLKENEFMEKSSIPPIKILSLIPDDLKHYFYRGFFDGDGCIYIKPKQANQLSFSGAYGYDWKFITELNLGIESFGEQHRISKNGNKQSSVRLSSKKNIKKFADYMYQGDDSICLKRKRDKLYTISKG